MGDTPAVSLKDVGEHPRDSRLAVGSGNDNRSLRKLTSDLSQEIRVDPIGDEPGRGGAAATTEPSNDGAGELGGDERGGETGIR